jgi:tetratricopeptide (TPR) repeat protein
MKRTLLAALVLVGCSRNNIEAVNLSNDGDKEKATNIDAAISKWEQATQLDPDNARILWRLCQGYFKKENWAKASEYCAKGDKKAPTNARFALTQGISLVRQAQGAKGQANWTEARAPLEEAIKKDPNLSDAYFELAEVLLRTDDENGALRNYSKAIEVKPDESSYYGPLADLYMRLGFLDNAEQVAKEGLGFVKEGDKHIWAIHSLNGYVQEQKGNTSGAVSSYEAAKKSCGQCVEPGQAIAYFNLGAAYVAVKRNSEAVQQLEKFEKVACKGGSKERYSDQCAQAGQLKTKASGTAL